jgi:protein dithiol oxidoreductase (disulfide-forming)
MSGRIPPECIQNEVIMFRSAAVTLLFSALLGLGSSSQAATWIPGTHYSVIPQAQRTSVPAGKIEVMEVFSYGCPHCNQFRPVIKKLKASLPPNVQLVYLPASWNKAENWPLFQRAYLTAQSLGVAEKAHDALYEAVWTTGELGITDPKTGRIKSALPTIEDMARFYQRVTGVKAADFVAASKSFGVDLKVRQAESQILAMQVASTPTLVVNGKYRLNNEHLKGGEEMIELVKYLVAIENAAVKPAAAPAKKS